MRTFIALTTLCSLLSLPGVLAHPIEGTIPKTSYSRRALTDASTDHIQAREIADAVIAVLERRSDSDTYLSRRKTVITLEGLEGRVRELEKAMEGLKAQKAPGNGGGKPPRMEGTATG
jgi:hypothetical protein